MRLAEQAAPASEGNSHPPLGSLSRGLSGFQRVTAGTGSFRFLARTLGVFKMESKRATALVRCLCAVHVPLRDKQKRSHHPTFLGEKIWAFPLEQNAQQDYLAGDAAAVLSGTINKWKKVSRDTCGSPKHYGTCNTIIVQMLP